MMNLDGKQLSSSDALGVEKFCKYMWHMVVYLILEVWAVKLQLDLPWSVFNTGTIDSVWDRFPHSGTEKAAVKLFMMAQVPAHLAPRTHGSLRAPLFRETGSP